METGRPETPRQTTKNMDRRSKKRPQISRSGRLERSSSGPGDMKGCSDGDENPKKFIDGAVKKNKNIL